MGVPQGAVSNPGTAMQKIERKSSSSTIKLTISKISTHPEQALFSVTIWNLNRHISDVTSNHSFLKQHKIPPSQIGQTLDYFDSFKEQISSTIINIII